MPRSQAKAEEVARRLVKINPRMFRRIGHSGNHFEFGEWVVIVDGNQIIASDNLGDGLQDICLIPGCASDSCIPISEEVRNEAIKYAEQLRSL